MKKSDLLNEIMEANWIFIIRWRSKESVSAMMAKTLPGALTGLGLFVPDENPNGYFEHSGANLGYVAEMCFQVKAQKGFVAMVNSSVSNGFMNELENAVGSLRIDLD